MTCIHRKKGGTQQNTSLYNK